MTIGEEASEALANEEYLRWIGEAYGESGIGVSGTALFVVFLGALGLFNWSESFKVPVVWLTIMTPLVASTLPVPVVWRFIGIITTAIAMLFAGLYLFWSRV